LSNVTAFKCQPIFQEDGSICDPTTGEIISLDQISKPTIAPVLAGPQIAAKFIADLFGATTEHDVHICRYPNDNSDDLPFRKLNTRDTAAIERFVEKYDEPGGALYSACGTIKPGASGRTKQDISEIGFLWADIDLKDTVEDRTSIEKRLSALVSPAGKSFAPSYTVFSGHGIHCYWLLSEVLDAQSMQDRVEEDLRLLCDLVGGDINVCEIARVMRLPGSHNSKFDGEMIPVEILTSTGNRYHLEDLEEMLAETAPIILRKERPECLTLGQIVGTDPYEKYGEQFGFKPPIDVQAMLAEMLFMGGKKHGVNPTQISVEASMINSGHSDEEIVAVVLAATRDAAGDYGKRWNWDREEKKIRRDIAGWHKRLEKEGKQPKPKPPVLPGAEIHNIADSRSRAATQGPAPLAMTLFDDVEAFNKKDWLIKNAIAKGETSMLVALPKKLKSALVLDIAISIAAGADWREHKSKEAAGVVYFAFERADLVKRRLAAHRLRDELTGLPIAIVGRLINLMHPACVGVIVATIRDAEKRLGRPIGFAAFDTLAKGIAAGGGNENDAQAMGAALAHLRQVQEQTGVHVMIVHHTGKDEGKGPRGSNSSVGDVDLLVQITGDVVKTATITAANDQAEGVMTRFKGEVVVLGVDEDGDEITTMIVSIDDCGGPAGDGEAKVRLSPTEQRGMQLLYDALNDGAKDAPVTAGFPRGAKVVPVATWKDYCERGVSRVAGLMPSGKHSVGSPSRWPTRARSECSMTSFGWPMISTQKRERTKNVAGQTGTLICYVMSRTFVQYIYATVLVLVKNVVKHPDLGEQIGTLSRNVRFCPVFGFIRPSGHLLLCL
jgi:hypothetical protein